MQQCSDELNFLLIAFRQLLDFRVALVGELETLEPFLDLRTNAGRLASFDLSEEQKLFDDFHLLVESALFRQIPDAITKRLASIPAEPLDRSRVRHEDAGDHANGSRLP